MFTSAALFERYESRIQLAVINNSGWKMFMKIIHVQMYEFFLISLKVKRFLYLIEQSFWSQPRSQIINLKASISKFEKKRFFFFRFEREKKVFEDFIHCHYFGPTQGHKPLTRCQQFYTNLCNRIMVTIFQLLYNFPTWIGLQKQIYLLFFKFDLFMQFLGTPLIPWGN